MVGKPFEKGKSGNPGGRPKEEARIQELARCHSEAALDRLVFWMNSDNAKASVTASDKILDRAYGKAPQGITLGGDPDNPIKLQDVTDLDRAKALAALLSKVKARQ